MSHIKDRLTRQEVNYIKRQLLSHFDTARYERSWGLPDALGFGGSHRESRKVRRILKQLHDNGYIEHLMGETTDAVYRTTDAGQRELRRLQRLSLRNTFRQNHSVEVSTID